MRRILLQSNGSSLIEQTIDETQKFLDPSKTTQLLDGLVNWFSVYFVRIIALIIFVVVSQVVIKWILKTGKKMLSRSRIEPTMHKFLISIIRIALNVFVVLVCFNILNYAPTILLTIFGAVGLAFSLAVKDSLSNLAGGVSVLMSHPFSKGDLVKIGNTLGVVHAIDFSYTQLITQDKDRIYFPNGDVAKAIIVNYSTNSVECVELKFFLPSSISITAILSEVNDVLSFCAYVLQQLPKECRITDKTKNSATLSCQAWVRTEDKILAENFLNLQIEELVNNVNNSLQ